MDIIRNLYLHKYSVSSTMSVAHGETKAEILISFNFSPSLFD